MISFKKPQNYYIWKVRWDTIQYMVLTNSQGKDIPWKIFSRVCQLLFAASNGICRHATEIQNCDTNTKLHTTEIKNCDPNTKLHAIKIRNCVKITKLHTTEIRIQVWHKYKIARNWSFREYASCYLPPVMESPGQI